MPVSAVKTQCLPLAVVISWLQCSVDFLTKCFIYAVYEAIFVERRIDRFLLFYHVAWAEDYLRTKWHLDPSSHLATTNMGQKLGKGAMPLGVELGPHLIQCCPVRGLPSYQVASWSIQPFGHNKNGPKIGGCSPSTPALFGGAESSFSIIV